MNDVFFVIDYETTGIDPTDVPIEVGICVTDAEWDEPEPFSRVIYSDYASRMTEKRWSEAERIHGMSQDEVRRYGQRPEVVARDIVELAKSYKTGGGRLILLSDNIQFEWRHTQWLLQHIGMGVEDVFHYCGWDTSILGLFTDFEDPQSPPHRALPDAELLVSELRRVHQKTKTLLGLTR